MADAREAKRLLDALPADDPLKALEDLAHWHESVSAAAGFRPEPRIALHFMLDEAAQPRLRRLAREYLGPPVPSRFQENRIWSQVHDYYRHTGQAFGLAVDSLQAARADAVKPLLGLLLVRTLRTFAQQLRWSYLRYGPVDPALWRVLNRVYAFAEARGLVDLAVPAIYPGAPGPTSPRLEFVRALMLNVSSPDSLMPAEMELAERLIEELSPGCLLATEGGAGRSHWTDLGEAMAPRRLARLPERTPGLRFLGAGGAFDALQALVKRTQSAGPPAHLGADREVVLGVMEHLLLYWSAAGPERKHPRHTVQGRLAIMGGFGGVVGALWPAGQDNPLKLAPDAWVVENVSAGGFGAIVPPTRSDWLKIGSLLALQADGGSNWVVGAVRRVSRTPKRELRVGIETLSRTPQLVQFAPRGPGGSEVGVLLPGPERPAGETAIALRAGSFVAGQKLESERGGRSYVYLPQGAVEQGEDYDLVRCRELVRDS